MTFTITSKLYRWRVRTSGALLVVLSLLSPACWSSRNNGLYYGRVVIPREQEFRWSDGGLPQVFDPAFAAAPPDTDVVRALFEGLTDYDSRTLQPMPAVAERWESSDDGRVWTFYLRRDARWSTGEPVTAGDFVRSWERTLRLGDLAPHTELLNNIVGARSYVGSVKTAQASAAAAVTARNEERANETHLAGVTEVNANVLRVKLQEPNADFPALVAHPVFRPVKVTDENQSARLSAPNLISNGAFSLTKADPEQVQLQRAENYWGKAEVSLQRVDFVKTQDAEDALASYQAGNIDAVTNAPFEPLALKLLAPYADYRRTTYAALTYYTFNTARAPFDDVRVREALAIVIDRERISEEEMKGATEPANSFLPLKSIQQGSDSVVPKSASLDKDHERARRLLAEAGYENGNGFPMIRLLINRNDQQRQVAEAVAASWRSVLGIETQIISKPWEEYEVMVRSGEYDLVRRGAVMQTTDEASNLRMLFAQPQEPTPSPAATASPSGSQAKPTPEKNQKSFETEAEAMRQLAGIPIYFASSYSLVKPYVIGFESNVLDAPSLKNVRIDTNFKTK